MITDRIGLHSVLWRLLIRVIKKSDDGESRVRFVNLWLKIELDDTKCCYQIIKLWQDLRNKLATGVKDVKDFALSNYTSTTCTLSNMPYWPSVRSRWLDIDRILFYGPRRSRRKVRDEVKIQSSWPKGLGQYGIYYIGKTVHLARVKYDLFIFEHWEWKPTLMVLISFLCDKLDLDKVICKLTTSITTKGKLLLSVSQLFGLWCENDCSQSELSHGGAEEWGKLRSTEKRAWTPTSTA